jgi:hypothetical protein
MPCQFATGRKGKDILSRSSRSCQWMRKGHVLGFVASLVFKLSGDREYHPSFPSEPAKLHAGVRLCILPDSESPLKNGYALVIYRPRLCRIGSVLSRR